MMRHQMPFALPGMTIGLLGGSFDPAHEGHAHLTREAIKRFGLDRVWWLVSPGNPLKKRQPAPMAARLERARQVMDDPRVQITDIEARLGTRYTAATIRALRQRYPGVRFVWLMGADNLAQFHLWDQWEWIMQTVPVGVLARPGNAAGTRLAKAAERFLRYRLPRHLSRELGRHDAPAWAYVNMPMRALSSSAIRARGDWTTSAPKVDI